MFYLRRLDHYTTQCPRQDKGKELTIKSITTEVHQGTAQSKAKVLDWEVQDKICKAAKVWVEKANEANIDHMRQDGATEASS